MQQCFPFIWINIAKRGVRHRPQCHFVSFYANLTLLGVSSLSNGYASNDPKRQSHRLIFIQKQKQFWENQKIQYKSISFHFIRRMLSASAAAAALKLVHHHKPELLIKILDSINLPVSLQRCSWVRNTILKKTAENSSFGLLKTKSLSEILMQLCITKYWCNVTCYKNFNYKTAFKIFMIPKKSWMDFFMHTQTRGFWLPYCYPGMHAKKKGIHLKCFKCTNDARVFTLYDTRHQTFYCTCVKKKTTYNKC